MKISRCGSPWLLCWVLTAGCNPPPEVSPGSTPVQVVSTRPDADETSVSLGTDVNITFSEALDPSTVTAISFTVEDHSGLPVAGTVAGIGAEATFTPTAEFSKDTTYKATVTTAIQDAAGNHLASNVSWKFSTLARAWTTQDFGFRTWEHSPRLGTNESGGILAVWVAGNAHPQIGDPPVNEHQNIFARKYDSEAGWAPVSQIEFEEFGSPREPKVAVDAAGNAIVVWTQFGETDASVWAVRFSIGGSWEPPRRLASSAEFADIAMDAAGNAIVVWQERVDGYSRRAWANRFTVDSGWGTAEPIETDAGTAEELSYYNNGDEHQPSITLDGMGNAVATWLTWTDGVRSIVANRFVSGVGWGADETIARRGVQRPALAADAAGNAFVVWRQRRDSQSSLADLWVKRYAVDSGWRAQLFLATGGLGGTEEHNQLAVSATGDAAVVWADSKTIWVKRYVLGSGWETVWPLETDPGDLLAGETTSVSVPAIAMNAAGDVVASWTLAVRRPGLGVFVHAHFNRYLGGQRGWGTSSLAPGVGNSESLVISESGDVVSLASKFLPNGRDNTSGTSTVYAAHLE